jgi:penicillin-binding protein 2
MASPEERRRVGMRLTVLQSTITVVFSILAVSFWVLQVVQHEQYLELAENNHQRTLALRAPRGMVFDRHNELLVRNRHSYSVSIVREHTKDLNRTVRLVATLLGIEEAKVREIVERNRREPVFRPIQIVHDATEAQLAAVLARRYELPDVLVEQVPTREYPGDPVLAAHVFGYVGEVSELQVAASNELKSGDIVGQSGVERIYNELLMGEDGAKRVVVNSVGREIRVDEKIDPTEGKRLQLTIDADVQRSVEASFRALGLNGAAVLLEPATGEVLAYTSLPAYDPNAFAAGGDRRASAWSAVMTDTLRPLNDRALQGRYSPGSTFKMTVAAAALEEGLITPDYHVFCGGSGVFHGNVHKCWKAGGHGWVDLRRAIEGSCNVYFYTIGNLAGVDRIHKWATAFGLGVKSGIDLPNEISGIMPSTEWKQRTTGEKWYPGETTSVAIGQGQVTVTPISMAVMMATIANGGTRVTPHVLKAVDDGSGWKPVQPPAPQSKVTIKPHNLQAIRDGLWMVVNNAGTGGRARIAGRDVSGKTGTAQVISLEGGRRASAGRSTRDLRDHGWFVFFAPRDNPQIAGVIFAEHAEHGSSAAPIAKHALETFFAKQEGAPLPAPLQKQPPPPPPNPPEEPRLEGSPIAAATFDVHRSTFVEAPRTTNAER